MPRMPTAICENATVSAEIILQNSRNYSSCTDRGAGMVLWWECLSPTNVARVPFRYRLHLKINLGDDASSIVMDDSGFKFFSSFPSPSLSNRYLLETFNWVYSRPSPERLFIWENSHLWPSLTAGTITEHLSLVTKCKSTDLLFRVNVAFLSKWMLFAIAWLRPRLFPFSFFSDRKGWPEALLKDRSGRSLGISLAAKDAVDCIKDLVLFKGFHFPRFSFTSEI